MDVPQIIAGRFRVEREIGRGGMGTVYRARQLGLERLVAIKVLKQEFAADPEVAERFMREARTMSRLRHTRATMIFDAGRLTDGRPFIVMEYVEGATLAETLAREGRLTPERAVRIASEICDVLAEAHSLGIVHRDLKPSNIMLNERGVCVLDFGIAKVLATSADATRTHATTESGLIIGTPRYMSPEQCMGQTVGPASDLYSVGVLLYEMLAGQPPFVDPLQSAVLVKQATAPPPPLIALRAEMPRQLAFVVHVLLAKNPANRPKTAMESRTLLEKSLRSPSPVAPETTPFASTIATLDTGRSVAFNMAMVAVVLVMLSAALLVWARSGQSARKVAAPGKVVSNVSRDSVARSAPQVIKPILSPNAARRIAAKVSNHGYISEARVVRTESGPAIVAVHNERQVGRTHLFMMERKGTRYRVTGQAPLDTEGFRGAHWTAEVLDADGDGYEEVLCTGADARNDPFSRRLVLYVPRERQAFSLRVGLDGRESNAARVLWSSNAATENAKPYRSTLRQRALADWPSFLKVKSY